MRLLKIKTTFAVLSLMFVLCFAAQTSAHAATVDAESDARQTLERAFGQLKSGDYSGAYDVLPSAVQRRVSREQFTNALSRSRDRIKLDRIEITTLKVFNDVAVADTVIYGRVRPQPQTDLTFDGKIVVRQYLTREDNSWRVTTGDTQTVRPLLQANPQLARRFPPRQPRIYFLREGQWIELPTQGQPQRRGRN